MDFFSLASNLQQIAIGGVNFVNNKLRKKSSNCECNYVTYIIIGENEIQPYDINMFFFPFKMCTKIKLKEFKEYFPFKGSIIFRFKIPLTDLIDVINEGIINNVPLLKDKGNRKNLDEHIISDENEIKNILRQDNINHVWVDVTNEEAYIPTFHGNIVAKVLFINHENYKNYNDIYIKNFKNYECSSQIYNVNEKSMCSYKLIKEEKSKKNDADRCDIMKNEEFNEKVKTESRQNNLLNFNYSIDNTVNFHNAMRNYEHNVISNEEYENKRMQEKEKEDTDDNNLEEYNIFQNVNKEKHFLKERKNSHILNTYCEDNRISRYNQNENIKMKINKKASQEKNNFNDHILEKHSYTNTPKIFLSPYNTNNQNNQVDIPKMNYKSVSTDEKQDAIKENVSNRLQELKDFRHQEEEKFKEKVVISEKIKKQIVKWSKNSDDTYKDIKVMLSTLNDVLWENSEWKHVPMSDLITNTLTVKKTYKNAILLCHPDKHRDKSVERVLRAEMIFQALNNAYKEKRHI
ncbi:conserved Plasmodium protein, unknown function [Plasmodium malariae]|uniref:DnaJ protein n=1 Tax=Plasmodium malariae TaxID=5858 RepID=A0A1D3TD67_PLAMA|nr:conserved Plasmodium protein, unknown function [Plasmodium malariae]SCP02824.1 conserved Plasmodium protein, unknown function [Plasmodium malariae]